MSIHAMNLVWQNFQRGGSEKLALLAMADWCDDNGENLYPSIATVAKKICTTEGQARRIVHGFIADGILDVVGNHNGGAKGNSRRYRLNLEKLATTGTDATPSVRATPSMDARYPLHPCTLPLAPVQAKPPLTIIEPSIESLPVEITEKPKAKKPRKKSEGVTLQAFLDHCKAQEVPPIPLDDSIFEYAEQVGLTAQMITLAWDAFKVQFLNGSKNQKDWRAHFRNAVRKNWFKLWYFGIEEGAPALLTTAGQQALREQGARAMEIAA